MNLKLSILFCVFPLFLMSQDKKDIYAKYYEDQFYVGLQYNTLIFKSDATKNNGVPFSFQFGFIKDVPFNKQRNLALGIGVGYGYETLRPSVSITDNNGFFEFKANKNLSNYKYTSHNLEVPLEFRWRTSTSTNSSFWRIYTGTSLVYSFSNKAELDSNTTPISFRNIDELQKVNYSLYTSLGYGSLNFHIKYYLKPIFKDSVRTLDAQKLGFHQLKIGVMFYIL